MKHRCCSAGFIRHHIHQQAIIVIQVQPGAVLEGNPEPLPYIADKGIGQRVIGQGCGGHRVQPGIQAYNLMPALIQNEDGVLGHRQVPGQVKRQDACAPSTVPLAQPAVGINGEDFQTEAVEQVETVIPVGGRHLYQTTGECR